MDIVSLIGSTALFGPAYISGIYLYLTYINANHRWLKLVVFSVIMIACSLYGAAIGDCIIGVLFAGYCLIKRQTVELFWGAMFLNVISLQLFLASVFLPIVMPTAQDVPLIELALGLTLAAIAVGIFLVFKPRLTKSSRVMTINRTLTNQLAVFLLVTYLATSLMNLFIAMSNNPRLYESMLEVFIALILGSDILLLYFTLRASNVALENQSLKSAQEARETYYESIQREQQRSNKLLHDYKNILNTLKIAVASEDANSVGDTKAMLQTASDRLSGLSVQQPAMSQVPSAQLRNLLYVKWTDALNAGAKLNVQVDHGKLQINEADVFDLLRIIGILLDNAIEATADVPDKKVMIAFLTGENGGYEVVVRNQVTDAVTASALRDHTKTTKGAGHGYGLGNVRAIMAKNGHMHQKISLDHHYLEMGIIVEGLDDTARTKHPRLKEAQ